jgi:hypothetical protein
MKTIDGIVLDVGHWFEQAYRIWKNLPQIWGQFLLERGVAVLVCKCDLMAVPQVNAS